MANSVDPEEAQELDAPFLQDIFNERVSLGDGLYADAYVPPQGEELKSPDA